MASSTRKKARSSTSETTASVAELAAEAGRHLETAAMLRSIGELIIPRFHDDHGRLPAYLLRRQGSGPRPAQTEAVAQTEGAIESLAREFDGRAQALLGLRIRVGDRETPTPDVDFMSDEVVERDSLEGEFRVARGKRTDGCPRGE